MSFCSRRRERVSTHPKNICSLTAECRASRFRTPVTGSYEWSKENTAIIMTLWVILPVIPDQAKPILPSVGRPLPAFSDTTPSCSSETISASDLLSRRSCANSLVITWQPALTLCQNKTCRIKTYMICSKTAKRPMECLQYLFRGWRNNMWF